MNSDLAKTIIFGERLVGRVLELLWHCAGPPPNRVVVDVGKHKLRTRLSLHLALYTLFSVHLHYDLFRHVELTSLVPSLVPAPPGERVGSGDETTSSHDRTGN